MTDGPSHHQIQDLLAAHALGATDPDEAPVVDEHVAHCRQCADELARHRRVVDALPLEEPFSTEHHGAGSGAAPLRRRRRSWLWAAAVMVALVGLGVQTWRVGRLGAEVEALAAEAARPVDFDAVAASAIGQEFVMRDEGGQTVAVLTMTGDGRGIVTESSLAVPPGDRVYQLWAVVDGEVLSAGVLTAEPAASPFRIDPLDLEAFVITEEEPGGVAVSDQPAVASWTADG